MTKHSPTRGDLPVVFFFKNLEEGRVLTDGRTDESLRERKKETEFIRTRPPPCPPAQAAELAPTVQTFTALNDDKQPFDLVTLQVTSNYGHPDYTCVYRFRVHGDATPSK